MAVDLVNKIAVAGIFLHLVEDIPLEFNHPAFTCGDDGGRPWGMRHAAHFTEHVALEHIGLSSLVVDIRGPVIGNEIRYGGLDVAGF